MRDSIDPEDRLPYRFDDWPSPDRVAYLASPQLWDRESLVRMMGRKLDVDHIEDADLSANKRVSMEQLAWILVGIRDQARALERCQERVAELEQTVDRLERSLDERR